MQMIKQRWNGRLLVGLVVMLALLVPSYAMASGSNLYVNGKSIPTKQGQPFQKGDVTYLPLNSVVPGMGGKYSFSTKYDTATITKNKNQYKITTGKSVAILGGKSIALSTKTVLKGKKKVVVSAGNRALVKNNVMYVPSEFLQKVLGYPITFKGNVVYVGKIPKQQSEPPKENDPLAGWVAPTVNTTATDDGARNMNVLSDQLGFYKVGTYSAIFNPYTKANGPSSMSINEDASNSGYDVRMLIKVWSSDDNPEYNKTPYIAKEVFRFYGVSGVYDIINKGYNGVNVQSYLNRPLTFGNRQVYLIGNSNDSVSIFIGKPNQTLEVQ